MNAPEAPSPDTEKSLDDLYDAIDWSASEEKLQKAYELVKVGAITEETKYQVRNNFLNDALYAADAHDRVRARLFLGPIWRQVLDLMSAWGLVTDFDA